MHRCGSCRTRFGYFAEEGLQVGVEYAGGSSGALQLLAAGKGQFATSTPTQVMLASQQGLKIKAVFEHNRTYGSALVVPTAAGITTLRATARSPQGQQHRRGEHVERTHSLCARLDSRARTEGGYRCQAGGRRSGPTGRRRTEVGSRARFSHL